MKCSFAKKITALLLTAVVAVTVFGSVFKGTVRAEETGIRGYVERLYSIVLGRQPDPNGIDYWENRMKNGTTAADCAAGFFNSDEFRSKQLSDEEYVLVLYRAILGREADPTGLEGWTSSLKDGYPRARVLQGFISSDEFKGICSRYGVTPGNYNLTDLLDIHYVEAQFVKRAYSLILGRTADETGLRDWVGKISSGKISASQMVRGFILSDEYRGKNTTSDEYVEMLYNVILSRTSDPTGKQGWVELIDRKHVTRDYVLKGFVDSDEFSSLCAKYGVNKGTIDLSDPRDWNPDVNVFTVNAYMAVNQAMPSDKEIGYWAGEFAKGRAGKVLLESLFNTPGFKKLSSEEQIRRIYAACLGRKPSDTEVSEALKVVGKKGIDEFKKNIFHSQEFEKYCKGNSVGAIYDVGINVINGAIYYFDGTAMRSGWQRVNGQKYYFDPSKGYKAAIGWHNIGGLRYYFNPDGTLCQDTSALIGPQSTYYLTVNCATNTVMVYAKSSPNSGYDTPVKAMICSCGVAGNGTIQGDFTLNRAGRWRCLMNDVWGQYCTQISGNFLFHSAWYYDGGDIYSLSVREFNKLGQNASHGCVRLTVSDAKWIYDNCHGCPVHVFTSGEEAPFDKPAAYPAVSIHGDRGYDPRDPSL